MPRTLAQNAQYIAETIKPAIKSAIEAQGVTVPSTDSFLDYADRIGEISGGGSGYQLKDLPTGSIATVNDAAPLPLNALTVSVEAWQEGSGDPSPSNVRPIHGWDSGEIGVVGKNWLPLTVDEITGATTGWVNNQKTISNIKFTIKTDADGNFAGIEADGTATATVTLRLCQNIKNQYNGMLFNGCNSNDSNIFISFAYAQSPWTENRCFTGGDVTVSLSNGANCYAFIYIGNGKTVDHMMFYPQIRLATVSDPTFEPYQSKSYQHAFTDSQGNPLTCYGAEWDVVDGGIKVTDGYIASYNGETLPDTWISDRDVYASGTTPTTGAEVVYKLATPTTIPQQPEVIRMLEGVNNLYADCGEVLEGEYFIGSSGAYDLYDYIQSDGTQYINTGRKLSNGDVIRCLYVPQSGNSNWNYVWASYESNTVKGGLVFISSSIKAQYINGSETNRESYSDGTYYEDTLTMTADSNGDVYVFSYSADTACCSYMRLYAFSVNGDDYLPCKRRSDGVFGLYDVKNSTFLTDSASGNAFVGGNNLGVRIG